jgi:hypothetical protein
MIPLSMIYKKDKLLVGSKINLANLSILLVEITLGELGLLYISKNTWVALISLISKIKEGKPLLQEPATPLSLEKKHP